jgi:hypothetical protein
MRGWPTGPTGASLAANRLRQADLDQPYFVRAYRGTSADAALVVSMGVHAWCGGRRAIPRCSPANQRSKHRISGLVGKGLDKRSMRRSHHRLGVRLVIQAIPETLVELARIIYLSDLTAEPPLFLRAEPGCGLLAEQNGV